METFSKKSVGHLASMLFPTIGFRFVDPKKTGRFIYFVELCHELRVMCCELPKKLIDNDNPTNCLHAPERIQPPEKSNYW